MRGGQYWNPLCLKHEIFESDIFALRAPFRVLASVYALESGFHVNLEGSSNPSHASIFQILGPLSATFSKTTTSKQRFVCS